MIKLFQLIKNKFINLFKSKEKHEDTYDTESYEFNGNISPVDINIINLSITKLLCFEDVMAVCHKLNVGEVVCVNINHVEDGSHQRIIDFLSGFCLTINASFNMATKHIFMLIPNTFEEESINNDDASTQII